MTQTQDPMAGMIGASSVFEQLDEAIMDNNKRTVEREQRSKYPRLFSMPEQPNEADGTRTRRIRFQVPWSEVASLMVHDKWQTFSTPCPLQYGKSCRYCAMTEEARREEKIKDQKWFIWPVWNYEGGRDNKGELQLLAYQVNNASPIPAIHSLMKMKEQEAHEYGNIAPDIMSFDIVLVQHGKGQDRKFTVVARDPRPFSLPSGLSIPDGQVRKDALTFVKNKDLLDLPKVEDQPGRTTPADDHFNDEFGL